MTRLIVYELKRKPSLAAVTFVISLRWGGGGGECEDFDCVTIKFT